MERIIKMAILCIFRLPIYIWRICHFAKHRDSYTDIQVHESFRKMATVVNRRGSVKIETYGEENIPEEDGFMFYPNHQGMFDVLAFFEASSKAFSVVMKKELENIILIRKVFIAIRAKAIDREDLRQSMKVINTVASEVKDGRNYIIFAEGTRNRDKNNVHEFKAGSFKIATKAKCPIVPVALVDSYKAFDSHSISKMTVQIHFLPPLYYEDYKGMNTTELAQEVQSRVQNCINESLTE